MHKQCNYSNIIVLIIFSFRLADSQCMGHQVDLGTALSPPNTYKLLVRLNIVNNLHQVCTQHHLPPIIAGGKGLLQCYIYGLVPYTQFSQQ